MTLSLKMCKGYFADANWGQINEGQCHRKKSDPTLAFFKISGIEQIKVN